MASSSSKRKRISVPDSVPEDKHTVFTQWAEKRGVEISGVKAAYLPGRGMGLVTSRRFKAGERLLFIPEKAMFKPNASLLEAASLKDISPQAQLAVSAMVEFSELNSAFTAWKKVLPTFDDFEYSMPMLSYGRVRESLPPPVLQPLERQEADYIRDEAAVRAFLEERGLQHFFRYWWLIVNSRSFHWKAPKSKGGVMVLCPFIDYMNHAPTDSACKVVMTDKGYKVVADRNYAPDEEILATYGPHSNDKLLVHYGFICSYNENEPTPDDDIRLDHIILPALSEEVRSRLQDVGFLGGYALLPASNELCFKTQVAIRAIFLTSNEWEYYVQNGEDLGEDSTFEVEKRVHELCSVYRAQRWLATAALSKLDQTPIIASLVQRWAQIDLALIIFGDKFRAAERENGQRIS